MSRAPSIAELRALLLPRDEILDRIDLEFERHCKDYKANRDRLQGDLDGLTTKLAALQKQHHPMECAAQHAGEAQWLISYTDDWVAARKVMDELDQSLKDDVNKPRLDQDADGSWGPCCHAPYRKLEPTVDVLQEKRLIGKRLRPLKFMAPLKDIAATVKQLKDLEVSDPDNTRVNNRDQLGARLTALSQLCFKDKFTTIFNDHRELDFDVSADYVKAYRAYLWCLQDQTTGFWGPTYVFDGKRVRVHDLSFTFHVIHYHTQNCTPGWPEIPNLDRIAATTLAMKDHEYPYGWQKPGGGLKDHNNYDVVIIFRHSWDAAPQLQKSIATEIQKLADWCLTKSLNGEQFGHGDPTISSYYYGVRFLDEIGLWGDPFWRSGPIPRPSGVPTPDKIRQNLQRGFSRIRDDSEYSETIAQILGLSLRRDGARSGA